MWKIIRKASGRNGKCKSGERRNFRDQRPLVVRIKTHEELLTALKCTNNEKQAAEIVDDLVYLGDKAVKPIIDELQNENDFVRKYLVFALGRIGKEAVKPLIINHLIEKLKDRGNGGGVAFLAAGGLRDIDYGDDVDLKMKAVNALMTGIGNKLDDVVGASFVTALKHINYDNTPKLREEVLKRLHEMFPKSYDKKDLYAALSSAILSLSSTIHSIRE